MIERQHFWLDFNANKNRTDGQVYEQTALPCEPEYANKRQGATFLRPPGVTKGVNDIKPPPPDMMERLGIAQRDDGIPF